MNEQTPRLAARDRRAAGGRHSPNACRLLAAVTIVLAGCSGASGSVATEVQPDPGSIRITTSTAGDDLDSDGYTASAGSRTGSIGINDALTFGDLEARDHAVALAGVQANCEVAGQNPRTISVHEGGTTQTTFEVICTSTEWTTLADMPTARLGLATTAAGGIIYAIGGYRQANDPGLTTVEAYDPSTDTWTTKAPMPTGRRWLTAVTVNGRIFAIGGHVTVGAPGLSAVEEYDPATDSWVTRTPMPTRRLGASAAVLNGRIYVVGGSPDNNGVVGTVEEYDPALDQWSARADMPTARALLALEAIGGRLHAIGGGADPGTAIPVIETYDPVTDTWTSSSDVPSPRTALCSAVVDAEIYLIGGASGGRSGTIHGANWAFGPATAEWTPGPELPRPRAALSCTVVDGSIYAIGGTVDWTIPHPGVKTVERYRPNEP